MREVPRKVRTEISGAVLEQAPCHVDPRIFLVGEFDVRVGFIVAQKNIETGLVALDQFVFERQRFLVVADQDIFDIRGLGN